MSIGLLLIDIQNDYFPNGKMELHESEKAGKVAGLLLNFFREKMLPTFHIQHIAGPKSSFFVPNTEGVEIHQSVMPFDNEIVIQKNYPNAFRETDLLQHLQSKNILELVVVGMMTHMCVDATVRAATDHGFGCLIAYDACATRNLTFENREVKAQDVHSAFLAAFHGTYGQVMSAKEIMTTLTSQFK